MERQPQTITLYNRALEQGCIHSLTLGEDRALHLRPDAFSGAYLSPGLDCGDPDLTWHRLVLDGEMDSCRLEVVALATNQTEFETEEGTAELESYLADPLVPHGDKVRVMLALGGMRAVGHPDLLLHTLTGRRLWVCVTLSDGTGSLRGLRIELPKHSFLSAYFPEVYQQDDGTFERYVGVFQSLFSDLERRVDEIPALLDYRTAPDGILRRLARWAGVDTESLTAAQLRRMLARLDLFQGAKGTRRALVAVVELVTGHRPVVVEHFQFAGLPSAEWQSRLYGEGPGHFAVILNCSGESPLPLGRQALERIIREYAPLGTSCRLVVLERCVRTDLHCYLGLNSAISTPESARVGVFSLGDPITAG